LLQSYRWGIPYHSLTPYVCRMEDTSLLYCITSFGTRKSCDISELISQVGQHGKNHLYAQLDRLERAGIIYINNMVVSIKNPSTNEGVMPI
jgi:hypothetical protein